MFLVTGDINSLIGLIFGQKILVSIESVPEKIPASP